MPALERLQKCLARCGYGSRRACETLIEAGRVRVNGAVASLGTKVDPATDRITVDNKPVQAAPPTLYLMLNKPAGYVTTRKDPHAKRTVMELLGELGEWLYPVGRLDVDTEGLLLLTNDGDLTHQLLHPGKKVPKTYRARVKGVPEKEALERFRAGIELEDGMTAPAEVHFVRKNSEGATIEITLTEGRKRQVKRMCAAIGHPVLKLKRIQFGPLRLGQLAPGEWRVLTKYEVHLLKSLSSGKPV